MASRVPLESSANASNNPDIGDKRRLRDEIVGIMQNVQQANVTENQLFKEIRDLYARTDKKLFVEVFFRILIVPFSRSEAEFKPLLTFCNRVITNLDDAIDLAGHEGDKENHSSSFRVRFLRLFLKTDNDVNPVVRQRLLETVNKIFATYGNVQEKLQNERNLINSLKNTLFRRIVDKSADVRVEAATALSYLQEKEIHESDPVGERLIFHLRFDPSVAVRKAIVHNITFLKDDYLIYLIETVHDRQDSVREAGYIALAKYPITAFSSHAKKYILSAGSLHKSSSVQKAMTSLVNAWYEGCNENILELVQHFDLVGQRKLVEIVLDTIFPNPDLVTFNKVDWTIFVDNFVPLESLTEHKAFFWRFIVKKFVNSEFAVNTTPSVSPMCDYIRKVLDAAKNTSSDSTIFVQLLQLVVVIPLEEGGRYALMDLMRVLSTFEYLEPIHVKYLVLIRDKTQSIKNDTDFLMFVREIMIGAKKAKETVQETDISTKTESEELSQEIVQALKLEAGKLVHERYELIKERDMLKADNQFWECNLVQIKIGKRDTQISGLRRRLGFNPNRSHAAGNSTHLIVDEEMDEFADFPDTALHLGFCAVIVYLRLHKEASLAAQEFVQSFSKDGLRCLMDSVRGRFLELSTLVAYSAPYMAVLTMVTCVTALLRDVNSVKFTAVGCIFDLAILYGLEYFHGEILDKVITKSRALEELVQVNLDPVPLKIIILYLLNMNDIQIQKRTVLGICKLLLTSRIKSSSIIVTLMMLWNNPQNESSTIFRDITAWLPNYTRMGLEQACRMADCIVPCCTRILQDEMDPAVRNARMEKFIEFIVTNTDQRVLTGTENARSVHTKIALNVLDEMALLGKGSALTQYALSLKTLNLESIDASGSEDIRRGILKVRAVAKTSQVNQSLDAFEKYLDKFDTTFDPSIQDMSSSSSKDAADDDGAMGVQTM